MEFLRHPLVPCSPPDLFTLIIDDMQKSADWDHDSIASSCSSSDISSDDEDLNTRVSPDWARYRSTIERRGFRLDTVRDVKEYYQNHHAGLDLHRLDIQSKFSGYKRACASQDENDLCKDAGLCDNLFRGTRCCDRTKVMVKAVHLHSREFDIMRSLSAPPLRDDPMNHCIPVLDMIEVPRDGLGFIVMEEWSPELIPYAPCCVWHFLHGIRQCAEHLTFMHKHHIAHLDVSLRNFLTDYQNHYACIDYESSRKYDGMCNPQIPPGYKGTEVPPEFDRGEPSSPYKVDIWALGVMFLRAQKLAGLDIPELLQLTAPMLHPHSEKRPALHDVLQAFDRMMTAIDTDRLMPCD